MKHILVSSFGGCQKTNFSSHFVIVLALLSTLNQFQATALECYECTNEDVGCDKNVGSTPNLKKECQTDAVGCAIYAVYYDYVFGAIFHRSCVYSYDMFNIDTRAGWVILNNEGYNAYMLHMEYKELMEKWNHDRKKANPSSPSVIQAKHSPLGISGYYQIRVFSQPHGNLSNGMEFSSWTWPTFKREETPKINSIQCYSCEFEIKGKRIFAEYSAPSDTELYIPASETYNIPPCGSRDISPLKMVTCKNAYGCAAFLEIKNASNAMSKADGLDKANSTVSRVWRGCWHPGDQKCLRDPDSIIRTQGRTSKTDTQTAQCENAYKRSYATQKGVVVWAGVKPIKSTSEYNKYLECRHNVRLGLNEKSELKVVSEVVDNDYTWIQYQFCGPKSGCNKYEEMEDDHVGKAKYNPKDYEDVENPKITQTKTNSTKLDECKVKEDEDEKNAAYNPTKISNVLKVYCALIFLCFFL